MTSGGHAGRGDLRPRDVAPLGVFVHEAFLDDVTLARVRHAMAAGVGEPAAVQSRDAWSLALDTEARVTWEVELPDDLQEALVTLVNRMLPTFEEASGVALESCEAVAALRYPAGSFYGPHRDVSDTPDEHGLHRREVSIVIFLNDGAGAGADFAGGRLRLYGLTGSEDDGVDVVPEAGTLVAFPSRLRHEVTRVTQGERQSLVTWLLAANGPECPDVSPGGDGDGRRG
ncbi:MAG: 2OG-Fe(II) oxygenase [Vicinamibacterales bacterium]